MVILIQVTVQDIHGQKFDVLVQNDAQVLGLKLQIWESRSIAPENQRLVFAGRQLQDEETLSLAGVQHGSVVFMVQQNEQTQAVVAQQQQQPLVQQQPIAFAQAVPPVVQPMSVQQPQPQVVVAPNNNNRETCCCCIPLRAGVLTLVILTLLGHIFHLCIAIRLCFAVPLWGLLAVVFNLTGIIIDCFAIFGWGKPNVRMLILWIWFQVIQLILGVIGAVALVVFTLVNGVDVHHGHHHGQGQKQGGQPMPNSYGDSTTSTTAPVHRNFSCKEKAVWGVFFSLVLMLVVVTSLYYIRAVHRYVKQLREEASNSRQVQVVNGVVYQQV